MKTAESVTVPRRIRGSPWFDDGNIMLLLSDGEHPEPVIAFKVHRGVIARHSEIFESMLSMPAPVEEDETIEGCQVAHLYHDAPQELSDFIKALYDGVEFRHQSILDFFFVAGILRLSTKYSVKRLRVQAIRHLADTWSYTLRGHDNMVSLALSSPSIDNASYPYVHPLHVLNLARETSVTVLIPSVLYFLSIYSLEDVLRANHPKLLVDHPSRPSSELNVDDIKAYTLMYQHRLHMMLDFIHKTCGERNEDVHCKHPAKQCRRAFQRLKHNILHALSTRTGPFHNMQQAIHWVDADDEICIPCKRAFLRDVTAVRERYWNELPSVIGLRGWDELVASDLPADA
ncbi:hypothetical protein OF83DRAFT_641505 [Amylostereum chailletii]|nr:hypothetical protein OF83DRAFT_641505 [Amylostereum chailletii]